MNLSLEGRTAIVTGAANGIGRAIVESYLQHGAKVLAVDLSADDLTNAFTSQANLQTLVVDLNSDDAPTTVVNAADRAFGAIDILVNNAGICIAGDYETLTDEQFDQIMGVNVRSIFRLTRDALPWLKRSGSGRIINLGSIMSDLGGPALAIYGASKHAVAGLTKGMAVDLGQHGITANFLQPGCIITKLSEPFIDDPDFRSYWENKAPVGRLGEPEDVANAALFLASEAAQFMSGTGVNVDGGAIINF